MPYVGQAVLPGDIVLVKGSRVMAMERLIDALKQIPLKQFIQATQNRHMKEALDPEYQTIEGVPPLAAGLRELAAALPSLG